MTLEELFFRVKFDGKNAIAGLKNIDKSMKSINRAGKEANHLFNSLVRLLGFAGATQMVIKTSELGRSMELLSDQTGIATDELSRLKTAFSAAGVGGNKLDVILQKINKDIQDTTLGKGSGTLAGMYINVRDKYGKLKKPDEVLKEIAQYAKTKIDSGKDPRSIANLLSSSYGIDQQTANILMQGPEYVDELIRSSAEKFGSLSTQQTKDLSELKSSLDGLKTATTNTATMIIGDLSPYLKDMADGVTWILGTLRDKWKLTPIDVNKERLEAIARGVATNALPIDQLIIAAQKEGIKDVKVRGDKIKFLNENGDWVEFSREEIYSDRIGSTLAGNAITLGMAGTKDKLLANIRYSDFAEQFKNGSYKQKEILRLRDALISGAYTEEDVNKAYNYGMISRGEATSYQNVLSGGFSEDIFGDSYAVNDSYARAIMQADNSSQPDIILNVNTDMTLNKDGTLDQTTSVDGSGGSITQQTFNQVNSIEVN